MKCPYCEKEIDKINIARTISIKAFIDNDGDILCYDQDCIDEIMDIVSYDNESDKFFCIKCNNEITPFIDRNKNIAIEDIIDVLKSK